MRCLFASDLHGDLDRYSKLFATIGADPPAAVFLGGDLLPLAGGGMTSTFLPAVIAPGLERLRAELGASYPRVFAILGNDDPRTAEAAIRDASASAGRTSASSPCMASA